MKPYSPLEEWTESPDLNFGLYERDGVKYYQVNGQPIASSKESFCETELANMMARPFRPAKQPKILVVGVGIGNIVNAFAEALPQKKASFEILDINSKSFSWFKEHLALDPDTPEKCEFFSERVVDYVKPKSGIYNGIFIDPELWRSYGQDEELTSKPYINHFVNALKMGGLLGVVTERPDKIVVGRMERSGLEVNVERFPSVVGGKRQRTIWLAKKGHYQKSH